MTLQVPLAAALGVFLLVLAAEKLHARRCRVVGRLATGPTGRPRRWVRGVPYARAVALGAIAWALTTLFYVSGGRFAQQENEDDRRENARHVVFVADLSPSMQLQDAGPDGDLTRAERAHEVVDGILRRLDGDQVYSVLAFYTDALPVIVDTRDAELVRNVFAGLPIWFVMGPGKTDLGSGVRLAMEHLNEYPDQSTTVFLCTDGDTIELGMVPKPPPSVSRIYVLGVGDPDRGTFIDGHMSRQDAAVLRTLAGRFGGQYIDVNEKQVPTLRLGELAMGTTAERNELGLVEIAIFVFAAGAAVLVLIPLLLEYLGSDWRAVRVGRAATAGGTRP